MGQKLVSHILGSSLAEMGKDDEVPCQDSGR